MSESELCATCACPNGLHPRGGQCLHCLAFERPENVCKEFVPQEASEFLVVNPKIIEEYLILMLCAGLLIGIGIHQLTVSINYPSFLLIALGLFIGWFLLRIIPKGEGLW